MSVVSINVKIDNEDGFFSPNRNAKWQTRTETEHDECGVATVAEISGQSNDKDTRAGKAAQVPPDKSDFIEKRDIPTTLSYLNFLLF